MLLKIQPAAASVHGSGGGDSSLASLLEQRHGSLHAGDVHLGQAGDLDPAVAVLADVHDGVFSAALLAEKVEQLLVVELHETHADTIRFVLVLRDHLEDVPHGAGYDSVEGRIVASTKEKK